MNKLLPEAYMGWNRAILPTARVANRVKRKMEKEEQIKTVYGDDYVDVTDDVQCYENGKTFKCDCGQDFGTDFDRVAIKCPSCSRHCVDTNTDERGPPDREKEQAGLSEWT